MDLTLWLLVPVKPFREGKSRLAPLLDNEERAALSRSLLEQLLDAAGEANLFAGIAVISRDVEVLDLAREHGASPLLETGQTLNGALEEARRYAIHQGADAIAILPADLPCLKTEDLHALVERAPAGRGMLIVPSETGGTNALLLRPPDALPFAFGLQSFDRHRELARERGLAVTVWQSATLAFDIDVPADLDNPALPAHF